MANEHNLTPFQKGNKAGVGHGAPRGVRLQTIINKMGDKNVTFTNKQTGQIEKLTHRELIVAKWFHLAETGHFPAIKEYLDREIGKVKDSLEVSDIRDKKAQDLTTEELESFLQEEGK